MIKKVLLTYDVSIKQTEVKNGMKGKGYCDNIKRTNETERYVLPNNIMETRRRIKNREGFTRLRKCGSRIK